MAFAPSSLILANDSAQLSKALSEVNDEKESGHKRTSLYKRVARILWKEWDDEYDGYVPSVFNLLIKGRDAH